MAFALTVKRLLGLEMVWYDANWAWLRLSGCGLPGVAELSIWLWCASEALAREVWLQGCMVCP